MSTPSTFGRRGGLALAVAVLMLAGALDAQAAVLTKARARAVAAAVNLTAADLPGFTRSSTGTQPGQQQFGARLARCAGGANPSRAIVNIDSADFSMSSPDGITGLQVNSNVTIMPLARLAAQDLAAARSARGRACLTTAVNQLLSAMKAADVTFGPAMVSVVDLRPAGVTGSFGLRFRVVASVAGQQLSVYVDDFGFTLGRVEVGLTTLGVVNQFPAADEQRLLTALIARARAHRA